MYHKNVYHYLPYYPFLFFMKNPCIPILTVHIIVPPPPPLKLDLSKPEMHEGLSLRYYISWEVSC